MLAHRCRTAPRSVLWSGSLISLFTGPKIQCKTSRVRGSIRGSIQDGSGSSHSGGHWNKRGRRVHVDGELRGLPGVLVRLLCRLQLPLRVRSLAPIACSCRARARGADVRARAVRAHCRSSRCARNPARRAHARRRARRPQRVGADAEFLLWFVPTCCAARCAGPRPRRRLSRTRRESSILGCSSSPSSARGSSVTTSRPSSARLQTTSSGERAVLHAAMRSQ